MRWNRKGSKGNGNPQDYRFATCLRLLFLILFVNVLLSINHQATLVVLWYAGNTFYNIYNKKAANMIHAHWFLAASQLAVGIVWSLIMWGSGLRKAPNLTAADIAACIPIGLFASLAHGGSVLASAVGAVSFAQIVKACEPVFAAVVGVLIPPADIKPPIAYVMLAVIVGGVGLACIKEGKGVDINVEAFLYASMANAAAALKGKLGSSVTKALHADKGKNMDSANVYAVINIISFFALSLLSSSANSRLCRRNGTTPLMLMASSHFF
jgi:solute carrier family 35, member E1